MFPERLNQANTEVGKLCPFGTQLNSFTLQNAHPEVGLLPNRLPICDMRLLGSGSLVD